jgi:hypothetical protein
MVNRTDIEKSVALVFIDNLLISGIKAIFALPPFGAKENCYHTGRTLYYLEPPL